MLKSLDLPVFGLFDRRKSFRGNKLFMQQRRSPSRTKIRAGTLLVPRYLGSPALLILLANSPGDSGTAGFHFSGFPNLSEFSPIDSLREFASSITFDTAGEFL